VQIPGEVTAVKVLVAGVDSLYLSFRVAVPAEFLSRLERLKTEASEAGEPAPICFEDGRNGVVHPTGSGHYRYWIHLADFDVLITPSNRLPAVYVKVSSLHLHECGADAALEAVERFTTALLGSDSASA
jgi:hypothetical protein